MQMNKTEARKPEQNQKTIRINVHFWTDGIVDPPNILPKHALAAGTVSLRANPSHGIKASDPIPFNSPMQIAGCIEELLIREGITLHVGDRQKMSRYITAS